MTATGALIRFALRRDRVRLPVWLGAITLLTLFSLTSFTENYPSAQDREGIAATLDTPAMAALTGPSRYLADYTYAAMLGHQMLYVTAIAAALMSVLTLVRHTRGEEESGRTELVRARVVGRHAPLAAALAVTLGANVALAGLLTGTIAAAGVATVDLPVTLLFAASAAAVGAVFTGVAAITVQLTEHTRAASGLALAVLGLAYVLRAVGDAAAVGTAGDAGGSDVASWLSPLGWAQRTYVGVDDRWWPLLLCLAAAAGCTLAGAVTSTTRDVGAGLRRPRPGRSTASAALATPLGFALRLHRSLLLGFAVAGILLGAAYGSIFGDLEEMLANVELWQELLAGFDAPPVETFGAVMLTIMAVFAAVYVALATMRPRAEEQQGRVESVIATGLSGTRWLASHLVVALAAGTLVMALTGGGFALVAALSTGDAGLIGSFAGSALAYAPALWFTAAVAVALFGWLPRLTGLVWLIPVYGFLVGYLGELFDFPGALAELSPFGHVPQVPAEDLRWTPLVVLTVLAAALSAVGLVGFRRRDV